MDADTFLLDPANRGDIFTQTTQTNIQDVIRAETTGYARLINILKLERQLLTEKAFEQFAELLTLKQQTLVQLDAINQFRVSLLSAKNLPLSREGIESLIGLTTIKNQEEQSEDLIAAWGKIIDAVEESKALNEINAKIAHRAQMTNHHVLNILRGMPEDPGLYNLRGKGRDTTGSGTIASA